MTATTTCLIRPATADDWSRIWPLVRAVAAAGETYTLARDLDELDARAMWYAHGLLVAADSGGTVLGMAKFGPNQGGPGRHVANASFMVGAAARGRGVGRALGVAVLDAARAAGFRAMQFNAVVETNAAAVALWKSLGFRVIGTVPEAFDHPQHGFVGLHVMHRVL